MGNINFATWNAGADSRDYGQLFSDYENNRTKSPSVTQLMKAYDEDANCLFETLASVRNRLLCESAHSLTEEADVCALQEVYGDNREDIKTLKELGFTIIRPSSQPSLSDTDTAIAIRTEKFIDIENRSYKEKSGFAIAVATEAQTRKKIAFVSAHIRGFDLEAVKQELEEGAAAGDRDISNLLNYLEGSCADCDTIFVGADMNAIPEIYQERFTLLENAGYELHRTGGATSLMSRNGMAETPLLQQRELDYIFVKHNRKQSGIYKICSMWRKFFLSSQKQDAYITQKLDPISTPSDHVPVYLRVTLV